jgi:hypothetical protein
MGCKNMYMLVIENKCSILTNKTVSWIFVQAGLIGRFRWCYTVMATTMARTVMAQSWNGGFYINLFMGGEYWKMSVKHDNDKT